LPGLPGIFLSEICYLGKAERFFPTGFTLFATGVFVQPMAYRMEGLLGPLFFPRAR
jgi:hypothetical protein